MKESLKTIIIIALLMLLLKEGITAQVIYASNQVSDIIYDLNN